MPLNCQTDEILDSLLSLSRFTSLVRWEHVGADYRSMRTGSPQSADLLDAPGGSRLPESEWIWTGASDGTITVGWILYNYPQNHNVPEWEDNWVHPDVPWVEITGLDAPQELELVWFDDHKGVLVGGRLHSTTGEFGAYAPGTGSPPKFGKSIAFLIQPTGFTPDRQFAELPNEYICQIYVEDITGENTAVWDEERPQAQRQNTLRFTAKTKPELDDPSKFIFHWRCYEPNGTVLFDEPNGSVSYNQYFDQFAPVGTYRVEVEIKDIGGGNTRVSGDIIHLNLWG